ncbi:hypothetical protein RFI_07008, partial [Reticulomyxa filosa]
SEKNQIEFLREWSDGFLKEILEDRNYECNMLRCLCREVLCNCVINPNVGFLEPYYINIGLIGALKPLLQKQSLPPTTSTPILTSISMSISLSTSTLISTLTSMSMSRVAMANALKAKAMTVSSFMDLLMSYWHQLRNVRQLRLRLASVSTKEKEENNNGGETSINRNVNANVNVN